MVKSKSHDHMDPKLLDCLVLHLIVVDEEKAKAISEATQKSSQLHDQMNKLRKKGKLKEYKEIKLEMLNEVKQADAIGVDLTKSSQYNNEIIKEILAVYFSILKGNTSSPLLASVFLGIPQFTQFINIEIVFDLINVLREYLVCELEPSKSQVFNIKNVVAGLLCAF